MATIVIGPTAEGKPRTGDYNLPPVILGATYKATQPTVDDGDVVNLQATARGTLKVTPGVEGFPVTGTVTIVTTKSGTTTRTQVSDSATTVLILASNTNRLGASIINTSTVNLCLRNGSGSATVAASDVTILPTGYYEVPFGYTGEINGIWVSDPNTGVANVVEYTA